MNLENLSIDNHITAILEQQGIHKLYPPQEEALPHVISGKNVVVAAPTAAGKSLIAYIAILQAALIGKKSIYIVPLRALAQEKYEDLLSFQELGIKIGISTGDFDQKGDFLGAYDIIVCTSEKADSLLRHGADWLSSVRIIVADEIHLINDGSRGPTMEVNLARFMFMQKVQIIALSATIKNARELADWLCAELIQSEWRPVPLKEGILFGRTIRFLDGSTRIISNNQLDGLLDDVLGNGGQALVFVNTRHASQITAEGLVDVTSKYLTTNEETLKALADTLIHEEGNILSKKLSQCIFHGVAFHHAGLSNRQRREVERGFKQGFIKCIVATPTLAAGVNTPARMVVIKNIWRYTAEDGGMCPIPVLEIKQMMGRAGRPGYDKEGEAILIAKNELEKERLLEEYLLAEVEPICSKLASEPALRMHVLSLIATEFAVQWDAIIKFMQKTFYVHQLGIVPEGKLWEILDFLEQNEFIKSNGEQWRATRFGRVTANLYLDPLSSLKMRQALKSKQGAVFSYLHTICATPDMRCLFVQKRDNWVIQKIEEETFFFDVPISHDPEYEWFLSEVKTASLLEDWILERKEDDMITRYHIGPGDIHAKVETAEWLLYAMQELARLFNFGVVSELGKLRMQITYGCKEELLPLVSLRGIGRVRARTLYQRGFKSIDMLRKASVEILASLPGIGTIVAQQIKEQVA